MKNTESDNDRVENTLFKSDILNTKIYQLLAFEHHSIQPISFFST